MTDFDLVPDEPVVYPDCIHEMPINVCDYCKPKQPKAPVVTTTLKARYQTRCAADCGDDIYPEEAITWSDRDDGYVHTACTNN